MAKRETAFARDDGKGKALSADDCMLKVDGMPTDVNVMLLEALPQGVLVFRVADRPKLIYANSRATDLCDCRSFREMQNFCLGDFWEAFSPVDYREKIKSLEYDWANRQDFIHRGAYHLLTKRGRTRQVRAASHAITMPSGEKIAICVITPTDSGKVSMADTSAEDYQASKEETVRIQKEDWIVRNFSKAAEAGEILVYYQPIVRTLTKSLCCLEALARWKDADKGFLMPGEFIPVLEEAGLIWKLDLYVLECVCKEMRRAKDRGDLTVPASVNLSRADFANHDMVREVSRIVDRYQISHDMIRIEVTESIAMGGTDLFQREIARFHQKGFPVWMDDFGSGYSCLNALCELPVDLIKLDMRFLSNYDEKSKLIIDSIVFMAKKLGIHTLAEGVEQEEQADFLRHIGCEKIQGYLFSKPMPMEEIRDLIEDRKLKVEPYGWQSYYDAAGAVNFDTDKAMALVEYDGEKFEFLYYNGAFRETWRKIGANQMKTVYENLNSARSPLHRKFKAFQEQVCGSDGEQEMVYSVRGHYVRLVARCLAEYQDHAIFTADISSLSLAAV